MPPLYVLVAALTVVALVAVATTGPKPASLATDIGLKDQDLCASVAVHARAATMRLNATSFPHATDRPVEVYRLMRADTPEQVLKIDWSHGRASCLPTSYPGPLTADVSLSESAYTSLVGELRAALETGQLERPSVGTWWALAWGTSIDLPEGGNGFAYKLMLAKWGAGMLGGP